MSMVTTVNVIRSAIKVFRSEKTRPPKVKLLRFNGWSIFLRAAIFPSYFYCFQPSRKHGRPQTFFP